MQFKKLVSLVLLFLFSNNNIVQAMNNDNGSITQFCSTFIKKHPVSLGLATMLGLGTLSYYGYRSHLVNGYSQALIEQQKECKEIKTIAGGILYPVDHGVVAVATDRANNYLVCGLENGSLQLRDFETFELYQETEPFSDDRSKKYSIRAVAMHPTQSVCAVAFGHTQKHEGAIGIYSINKDKSLTCQQVLYGGDRSVTGVNFSPNGSLLASISDKEGSNKLPPARETVKLWDTKDWACVAKLDGHINDGLKVSFNSDGKFLISSGYEEAKLWDVESRKCIKTFSDSIGYRIDTGSNYGSNNRFIATFHPKKTNLLALGDKNGVKLIDIENDALLQKFEDQTDFDYLPSTIEFDKKGRKIAVRYEDRERYRKSYLSWYDVESGRRLGNVAVTDNCGIWGNAVFDKKSKQIISGFNIAERFYEAYIQNPIAATIFEKLGSPVFRNAGQSFGRIGKFPIK